MHPIDQSAPPLFGGWLRQRRKALDLTQDALASMVGCSPDMVRKIETGDRRPSRQVAELLAEAIDLPLDERPQFVRWARLELGNGHTAPLSPLASSLPGEAVGSRPEDLTLLQITSSNGPQALEDESVDLINPYKGLQAFEEADAPYFFGREALVERLLSRLEDGTALSHFLAVVGPSGSGKSSVVRAGLIPALRAIGTLGGHPPTIVSILPGASPRQELEAALSRATEQRGSNDGSTFLLIDQFEELFTHVESDSERASFFAELHATISGSSQHTWVVVTLRADYYDRPLMYPGISELFRERTEAIGPMSPDEIHRAIIAPPERSDLSLEPGLVSTIERDVAEQPGALPLLEYALTELFERRSGRTFTLQAYRESGGVSGAVVARAEVIYSELTATEQEEARQLFLRLITLGNEGEESRRRASRAELVSAARDEDSLDRVLDIFGRYRLLTFDRDPLTRRPTVEVAHEALIRVWPRLREWLEASRNDLRVQRQLMTEAAEWVRSERDRSYLATRARLAQFEALAQVAGKPGGLALSGEELDYLRASLAQRDKERASSRRRVQWTIGGLLIAITAIGLFAFAALAQAGRASEQAEAATKQQSLAFSREVAAESAAEVKGDAMRSLLLGMEAAKIAPTDEAANAIRQALLELQPPSVLYNAAEASGSMDFSPDSKRVVIAQHNGPVRIRDVRSGNVLFELEHRDLVNDIHYSPDGKWIVGGSKDHLVWIWDAETGRTVATLTGHNTPVLAVAFSPDSRLVVSGSADTSGNARVWDVIGKRVIAELNGHRGAVTSVQFSPDSKLVVTAGDDRTARIWEAATGKELFELDRHQDIVNSAQFSPDGKLIATASEDNTALIWNASTGEIVAELREHSGSVNMARFSPDGKWLATASNDGTTRIWDPAEVILAAARGQRPASSFVLQNGPTMDARFSADSNWLVTTCSVPGPEHQWVARVWNVSTGDPVAEVGGQEQIHVAAYSRPFPAAQFSPDGKWLLVADGHAIGRVLRWEFYKPLNDLVTVASQYATRQLTCQERQTYLHEDAACGTAAPLASPTEK